MKEQIKADLPFWVLVATVVVAWVALIYVMFKAPRTPADWKVGYDAAVKEEQSRHAEAMGMGKEFPR